MMIKYFIPGRWAALACLAMLPWLSAYGNNAKCLVLPLSAIVTVKLADGTLEDVALTGKVHVTAQPRDELTRVHVNLARVSGVGSVSGLRYIATGANRVSYPPDPIIPVSVGFSLRAVAYPPDPVSPLDIELSLHMNTETATLEHAEIVSVSAYEHSD